jgi:phage replication initiation protein
LAHDDLEGLTTVEQYKAKYEAGEFTTGGRPPNPRYIDDMGSGKGKTLYIGARKNGKELCVYEKGKQLGDVLSPWVRVEGRYSKEDRIIPYDILTEPAHYLAAMYPPLSELSDTHTKIAIIKKHAEIALKAMIDHAATAYGKLINLMSELGHTDGEIVQVLKRDGIPKRVQVPMGMWAAQYVEDDRAYSGHIPAWLQGA